MTRAQALDLIRAAKTALALLESFHSALWRLFPDQLLVLTEEDERAIAADIARALREQSPS